MRSEQEMCNLKEIKDLQCVTQTHTHTLSLILPNCKLVKIKSSNVWYYNVYHFRKKIEHQPHRSMYYREKRYLKNPD